MAKIDGFFDAVDAAIDSGGQFLERARQSGDRLSGAKRPVIDVVAAETAKAPPKTSRRFRVIESIDAHTSKSCFVVTDGTIRTECPTAESAERVRKALEAT